MNVSSVKNLNGEVFSAVKDASLTNVIQTNSGNWQDITAYQNASATYLTAVDLTPYATTAEVESISSMLSGAIDYVSANAGDEFPASADEAIQYVQTNSAIIDETVTSYQTNSGTFLTAHQAISAEEWNDCYDNVNTNSGAWGGSALPISAGPGIKVNLVDNTLVFSNDETVLWSGAESIHSTNTFTLSEPLSSFNNVRFEGFEYGNTRVQYDCPTPTALNENVSICFNYYCRDKDNNPFQLKMASYSSNDGLTYGGIQHKFLYMSNTATTFLTNEGDWLSLTKIVGINRKQ